MKKILTKIAKKILYIETLEERKSDDLDFHEVSVWGLEEALIEAYKEGYKAGKKTEKRAN